MSKLSNLYTRVRVVLTAAPTYLVAASTAIAAASQELSTLLPDDAAVIVRYVAPVLAGLAVAVTLVRSVTKVLPEHIGLLSNVPYAPVPEPAVVPDPAPAPAPDVPFEKIP